MFRETIIFIIFSIYASTCSAVCVNQQNNARISDVSVNDPGVIAAAKYLIHGEAFRINKAQSQIVSGIIYYISVTITIAGGNELDCDLRVSYKSWLNEYNNLDRGILCHYGSDSIDDYKK